MPVDAVSLLDRARSPLSAVVERLCFDGFRALLVRHIDDALGATCWWGDAVALETSLVLRMVNARQRPLIVDDIGVRLTFPRNTLCLSTAKDDAPAVGVADDSHARDFRPTHLPLVVPADGGTLNVRLDCSLRFFSENWLGAATPLMIPCPGEEQAVDYLLARLDLRRATSRITLGVEGKLPRYVVGSRVRPDLRAMGKLWDSVPGNP